MSRATDLAERKLVPAAVRRRQRLRSVAIVLATQAALLALLLGFWDYMTANNKQAAFMFGSPSAIVGFLYQMITGRQPVARQLRHRHGDPARLSASATCSAPCSACSLWYSRFVSRVVQPFIDRARLDPDHRAGADRDHLVRHRIDLEGRDVDPVGGDRRPGHVLQGRDRRRQRPDQSDADARAHQSSRSSASSSCRPRSPTSLPG